jgi:hypothetical protein
MIVIPTEKCFFLPYCWTGRIEPEDIGWAFAEETNRYRALQSFFDEVDVLIYSAQAFDGEGGRSRR